MIQKTLGILTILLLGGGCSIIFEEDLSEETVNVNMPVNGTISPDTTQLFWWEPVEGALGYNLQIVAGSFDDPQYLLADTSSTGYKLLLDLLPGTYEWRINGWNNYSETDYFYSLLIISDSTTYEE